MRLWPETPYARVLECDEGIQIFVSDNSTNDKEKGELSQYCQHLNLSNLRYVTPPKPCNVSNHWDWLIRQALDLYDANHFVFLTDRSYALSPALLQLLKLVKQRPEDIITYRTDFVEDAQYPVRLRQKQASGHVFRLPARHLLYLASRVRTHESLPRMINTVVPRAIFAHVLKRFGSIFDSLSPDYCFTFRCLQVIESILFFDRSVFLSYATSRSNDWSGGAGISNPDFRDTVATLFDGNLCYPDSPIPELTISANAKVHEYCRARAESGSSKFPSLDREQYWKVMMRESEKIIDPETRLKVQGLIKKYGSFEEGAFNRNEQRVDFLLGLRTCMSHRAFDGLWRILSRSCGIYPSDVHLRFDSTEAAIDHAKRFPRRNYANAEHLKEDLEIEDLRQEAIPFAE